MLNKLKYYSLVVVLVLSPILASCGDHSSIVIAGPGLVGIDDRPVTPTPPELTVTYSVSGVVAPPVSIVSDQPTDGDIAFDPALVSFTITQGPDTLLFGVDNASLNRPEYRAFIDFPLDGTTGQPAIPIDATILAADLTLFVEFVQYESSIPVFIDLVEYSLAGLVPADYDSPLLASRSFTIFRNDAGRDIVLDVTPLMAEAQFQGLSDFQIRLLLGP